VAGQVRIRIVAAGVLGMVAHFWIGEYVGMAWSAGLVLAGVLHVAVRAWAGLPAARMPWPVKLHVALSFANMLVAGLFGMLLGLNRIYGWLPLSPMSNAFAHAHLGLVGWALMMVVGLSYRLIPMMLPAAMPVRRSMAVSAVLIELGLALLFFALVTRRTGTTVGALIILAGLASFIREIRAIVGRKLPPPAALRRPDWATWQTHAAFGWLLVAGVTGLMLTLPVPASWTIPLGWIYGVSGLIGFLAQVVTGIQGRLLPLYGWYRMFERASLEPPAQSAHTLANRTLAKAVLVTWTLGVPVLLAGLMSGTSPVTAIGSLILLGGVALNGVQAASIASKRIVN
jgi:hypothetical protein